MSPQLNPSSGFTVTLFDSIQGATVREEVSWWTPIPPALRTNFHECVAHLETVPNTRKITVDYPDGAGAHHTEKRTVDGTPTVVTVTNVEHFAQQIKTFASQETPASDIIKRAVADGTVPTGFAYPWGVSAAWEISGSVIKFRIVKSKAPKTDAPVTVTVDASKVTVTPASIAGKPAHRAR